MGQLVFNNTALVGTNKVGNLKKDENGYYLVVLGALEYPNSYGAVYRAESARELLSPQSPFMRQIKKGQLWGEYGHPEPDGLTHDEYMRRVYVVREKFQSHHIREVYIDDQAVDVKGRKYIAIMGWIKPSGPYASYLEKQLQDPNQCVSFSIRSFTNDRVVGGKLEKYLNIIITWDYVGEPGLEPAMKWNSPALEQFTEKVFHTAALKEAILGASNSPYSSESSLSRMRESLERATRYEEDQSKGNEIWSRW